MVNVNICHQGEIKPKVTPISTKVGEVLMWQAQYSSILWNVWERGLQCYGALTILTHEFQSAFTWPFRPPDQTRPRICWIRFLTHGRAGPQRVGYIFFPQVPRLKVWRWPWVKFETSIILTKWDGKCDSNFWQSCPPDYIVCWNLVIGSGGHKCISEWTMF